MGDVVSVPAELVEALREADEGYEHAVLGLDVTEALAHLRLAARAVVDAVETENECPVPDCRSGWVPFLGGSIPCKSSTHDQSPARDDAETVIAGLLAEHTLGMSRCRCGYDTPWFSYEGVDALKARHRAHVAFVIAAHMPAPDELTALRERIRALADEWARAAGLFDKRYGKQSRTSIVRAHVKQLRAALGDA